MTHPAVKSVKQPTPQGRFKPYPKYKDSGIEWLGKIPEHWHAWQLKRGYNVTLGKMLQSGSKTEENVLLPYLRAANIQWNKVDIDDIKEMYFSTAEAKQLKLLPGDLLVSEGGDVGRSTIWNNELEQCGFQNSVNRVRARAENYTRFLYYWMFFIKHVGWIDIICNKSTIAHFTAEKVQAVPVVFPTGNEQHAIATFLDRETARVDALIEKQWRLIELLKEKRQAVISHAVTKGLNPDAPMKDSGIPWLGMVPKHWAIKRLKYLLVEPLMYGANEAGLLDDPKHPRFIRITDFNDEGSLKEDSFKSLPHDIAEPYLLQEGDVLFARSGATVGKNVLYKSLWGAACFAGYLIRARVNRNACQPEFIHLFCQSSLYWSYIASSQIQATIQNVSAEKYGNLFLGIPSLEEQKVIIEFLDCETAKIDKAIEKSQTAISLLQEHRAALITAAVTGKIDVREAA